MTDTTNETNGLVTGCNEAIEVIKTASKAIKVNTQLVVNKFLTLNHIGSLDVIPHLATRMTQVMTSKEADSFRIFTSTMFPLKWDKEKNLFQDIPIKNKDVKEGCKKARDAFLEQYDNNYWLWIQANIKVEKKEVDWSQRFWSAWNSLEDPNKGGFDQDSILKEIIKKKGLSIEDFMNLLDIQAIEGKIEQEIEQGELEEKVA